MKLGDFEGWREKGLSDKRYFKFWQSDALQAELRKAGLNVLESYITPDKAYVVVTSKRV